MRRRGEKGEEQGEEREGERGERQEMVVTMSSSMKFTSLC